jgi:hypothetical protein
VAISPDVDPSNPRVGDAPIHWRPPQRLRKTLGPAAAIGVGIQGGEVVNVLGSGRIRIVAKYSAAGTLAAKWRLADHLTNQATNQPATVALVANTENVLDIPNNPGYAYLEVSITDGGAGGTVSYVDVFQTTEQN